MDNNRLRTLAGIPLIESSNMGKKRKLSEVDLSRRGFLKGAAAAAAAPVVGPALGKLASVAAPAAAQATPAAQMPVLQLLKEFPFDPDFAEQVAKAYMDSGILPDALNYDEATAYEEAIEKLAVERGMDSDDGEIAFNDWLDENNIDSFFDGVEKLTGRKPEASEMIEYLEKHGWDIDDFFEVPEVQQYFDGELGFDENGEVEHYEKEANDGIEWDEEDDDIEDIDADVEEHPSLGNELGHIKRLSGIAPEEEAPNVQKALPAPEKAPNDQKALPAPEKEEDKETTELKRLSGIKK